MGLTETKYDIELKQAPHLTFQNVGMGDKYSYKKQISRIYKFFDHAPSFEAKVMIEQIKLKIEELNQINCGVDKPEFI